MARDAVGVRAASRAGSARLQRDLPGSHEDIRVGPDWANLGRVPFARRPPGTGHQTPAWPERRLAQSATAGNSSAVVVLKALQHSPKPDAHLVPASLANSAKT